MRDSQRKILEKIMAQGKKAREKFSRKKEVEKQEEKLKVYLVQEFTNVFCGPYTHDVCINESTAQELVDKLIEDGKRAYLEVWTCNSK